MAQYPDLDDGDVLSEVHIFKFIGDDDEGTIGGTTDTELATVQVPANAASNGILILAEIELVVSGSATESNEGTFELRVGTNATVTSNASLRQKVITAGTDEGSNNPRSITLHASYMEYDTTLTLGSLNYVAVTGKTASASSGGAVWCRKLTVLAF